MLFIVYCYHCCCFLHAASVVTIIRTTASVFIHHFFVDFFKAKNMLNVFVSLKVSNILAVYFLYLFNTFPDYVLQFSYSE